jgi:hypothetical protein
MQHPAVYAVNGGAFLRFKPSPLTLYRSDRKRVEVGGGKVSRLSLVIRLTAYHCGIVAAQRQRRQVQLKTV